MHTHKKQNPPFLKSQFRSLSIINPKITFLLGLHSHQCSPDWGLFQAPRPPAFRALPSAHLADYGASKHLPTLMAAGWSYPGSSGPRLLSPRYGSSSPPGSQQLQGVTKLLLSHSGSGHPGETTQSWSQLSLVHSCSLCVLPSQVILLQAQMAYRQSISAPKKTLKRSFSNVGASTQLEASSHRCHHMWNSHCFLVVHFKRWEGKNCHLDV